MQLPGSLTRTTVGDVLGMLYRERATGVLELVEQSGARLGWRHEVYFKRGLVADIDTDLPVPRLGDILRAQGALTGDTERALRTMVFRLREERLGEALVKAHLCKVGSVQSALRAQLRQRVDAVCGVHHARLAFRVARRPKTSEPSDALVPEEFLHGRDRFRKRSAVGGAHTAMPQALSPRNVALAVLGLPEDADSLTIRQSFRRLAARIHPDRQPCQSEAEYAGSVRRFAELSAAYHTLMA